MIDLREFAKEQENERLREMAFQELALPRIKENFGRGFFGRNSK